MNDQNFKKIFIILSGLAIILFAVFLISLTFDISLRTKELWIGALILFLTIYIYYTVPIYAKVITIIASAIVMYVFLSQFVGWSMEWSIITSVLSIGIIASGYFAIG